MKFNLTTPCGDCPFRNDGKGIRLRRSRAQDILDAITDLDLTFSCHKTVEYDDEDDEGFHIVGDGEEHCAGALILLEHLEQPNQLMRIAERTGGYDRTKLNMDAPVFDDGDAFVDWHGRQG